MTQLQNDPRSQTTLAKRLSRRGFITRSVALGLSAPVVVSLLVACGDDDDDDPTATTAASGDPTATGDGSASDATATPGDSSSEPTATTGSDSGSTDGEPQYGGTLVVAQPNDWVTMFPAFTTGPTLEIAYDHLIGLEWNGSAWEFPPSLAESWELEADKAIFNLRSGVTFHDGTPLDAEAVRWNVEIWMTEEQSLAKESLGSVDPENPAEVLEELSVQINLLAPAGSLVTELSDFQRTTGIYSPAAFERLGVDGVAREAVGTGPFVFQEWQTGAQITTTRNENYWKTDANGNQLPYLDSVTWRWLSDDSVRLIDLRSQTVDFTSFIRGRDVSTVEDDSNLVYIEENASGGIIYRIFFNGATGPLVDDVALRQAILYAIDREAVALAVGGGVGIPATGDLLPGAIGYSDQVPFYSFDLEKAKELRAQSPAPAGVELRITIIAREADQQMAEMLQQMLGEIDVNIEVEVLERVAWGDQVRRNNDFEIATQRTNSPLDPDQLWTLTWAPEGVTAYIRADEPEIWEMIQAGRETYDTAERNAIYEELQTLMFEAAWWGQIWIQPNNYAHNARVKGVPILYSENIDVQYFWVEQ